MVTVAELVRVLLTLPQDADAHVESSDGFVVEACGAELVDEWGVVIRSSANDAADLY